MFHHECDYHLFTNKWLQFTRDRWREVTLIRKIMREKGVVKEVGSSWIQEQNVAIQL